MFLFAAAAGLGAALLFGGAPACAQSGSAAKVGDTIVLDARDALRRQDKARLAAARTAIAATQHPLAIWVDYWELSNRLSEASQDELDAFYARWPGTYVEDRLRNDWLLELGKRRDWRNLAREYPRFRMNDDREVSCYALLARHLDGEDVRSQARAAWLAQREADDGCALLASTLYAAGRFTPADVWRKARLATEANRQKVAVQAVGLIDEGTVKALAQIFDNPPRYLARAKPRERNGYELAALAVLRLAGNDPQAAATQLDDPWGARLRRELGSADLAWIWASVGKQAALKLAPEADGYYRRAAQSQRGAALDLPDDTLAWQARAALRADNGADHWPRVLQAIAAINPADQREATWVYWKARALQAMDPPTATSPASAAASTASAVVAASGVLAPAAGSAPAAAASGASDTQASAPAATPAQRLLESIADQYSFYGKLAAEELGRPFAAPPKPAPLTPQELTQARATPGLTRALQLIALGLRNEGVREWNYTLRGMGDRELLAAAQIACEAQVWDRCINTSDRTRSEIDMAQRFPTPYREDVVRAANESGIDPAYLYGLIRQESRFQADARSAAGAEGLMQVIPNTARWIARKLGLPYSPDMISDPATNLRLGAGYLKHVLDDADGSQALAAAAYNAGPNRSRRWRDGPQLDPAAWAENIPFNETRDYVKKVLSNATIYAAVLSGQSQSLKQRLGAVIGPRAASAPAPEKDLP